MLRRMGILSYLHLLQEGAYASIVAAVLITAVGGLAIAALYQLAQVRRELAALRPAPPPPLPPAAYPIPPRPPGPAWGTVPGAFGQTDPPARAGGE